MNLIALSQYKYLLTQLICHWCLFFDFTTRLIMWVIEVLLTWTYILYLAKIMVLECDYTCMMGLIVLSIMLTVHSEIL